MARKAQPLNPTNKKDWRDVFIDALSQCGVVTYASKAAGIHHSTAYDERKRSAEFAAQWDVALEAATDVLEREAFRRAVEGNEEYLISQGKLMRDKDGTPIMVRKYSDTLLIFIMKGARPQKYRDNYKPPEPAPDFDINADIEKMTPEEREAYRLKLMQYLAKRGL